MANRTEVSRRKGRARSLDDDDDELQPSKETQQNQRVIPEGESSNVN